MTLHRKNVSATTPSDTPQRMRAIVQDRYGASDVLHLEEIDVPAPGDGEVLVQVVAAGLDRGTWHLMTGTPYLVRAAIGWRGPRQRVPGRDVAGRVVAVGPGVERLRVGDDVLGIVSGSFAEYAVGKEAKLIVRPSTIAPVDAAALSISGLTALQGLHDVGRIAAGQQVLVIGASGGVGTFAVQIAAAAGAEVTGVCSTAKVDLVRSLGAHHVIDRTKESFVDGTRRYDLIFDLGGRTPLRHLRRVLAPRGTLVIGGGEGGDRLTGGMGRQLRAMLLSPFVRQRLTMLLSKERRDGIERLVDLVVSGRLSPSVERTYPLDEAAVAMHHLEAGEVRGKVVITV